MGVPIQGVGTFGIRFKNVALHVVVSCLFIGMFTINCGILLSFKKTTIKFVEMMPPKGGKNMSLKNVTY